MSKRKYHNPFGDYIRKLREDHKYTLQDIEAKSGISATYLSQLEHRANAKMSEEKIKALARAYKLPTAPFYLASGRLPEIELKVCLAAREYLTGEELIKLIRKAANAKRDAKPSRKSKRLAEPDTYIAPAEEGEDREESQ
jgi:transcriptional regulator with XRE-family HTH domain